jgi:predicted ABC-type ATPase
MAGLPGAGKTEFTKNLIIDSRLTVLRIDMDEIAEGIEGYSPEQASAFRGAASDILNTVFDRATHRRVDFIMDGTFQSRSALKNLQRSVNKGYRIKVIYISQEPEIAWRFTQDREKVEHRAIDKEGFIESYFNIMHNIKSISTLKIDNLVLDIVIKDCNNKVGVWLQNVPVYDIDTYIEKFYTKDELERILD